MSNNAWWIVCTRRAFVARTRLQCWETKCGKWSSSRERVRRSLRRAPVDRDASASPFSSVLRLNLRWNFANSFHRENLRGSNRRKPLACGIGKAFILARRWDPRSRIHNPPARRDERQGYIRKARLYISFDASSFIFSRGTINRDCIIESPQSNYYCCNCWWYINWLYELQK